MTLMVRELIERLRRGPLLVGDSQETYALELRTRGHSLFGLSMEKLQMNTDNRQLLLDFLQDLVKSNSLLITDDLDIEISKVVVSGHRIVISYNSRMKGRLNT